MITSSVTGKRSSLIGLGSARAIACPGSALGSIGVLVIVGIAIPVRFLYYPDGYKIAQELPLLRCVQPQQLRPFFLALACLGYDCHIARIAIKSFEIVLRPTPTMRANARTVL